MTEDRHPSLPIRFVLSGVASTAVALLDTGFDGFLAIPASVGAALPPSGQSFPIRTASGEVVDVQVFRGTVELIDQPGPITIHSIVLGDEYLLGLSTLNHFRIPFDHGERVIVEP